MKIELRQYEESDSYVGGYTGDVVIERSSTVFSVEVDGISKYKASNYPDCIRWINKQFNDKAQEKSKRQLEKAKIKLRNAEIDFHNATIDVNKLKVKRIKNSTKYKF